MATKGQGKKKSIIPFGLDEAYVVVRIPRDDLNVDALTKAFAKTPLTQVRDDGTGLRGVLRGNPNMGRFHSHFSVDLEREKDEWAVRCEIAKGSHGKDGEKVPRVGAFLELLRSALRNPDEPTKGLVSGHFVLPLKKWMPTFPLPFSAPGTLDQIPGIPQISGLDFSFKELGPTQPLLRAFVTTYDGIDEMVVRLLLRFVGPLHSNLTEDVLVAASVALPAFAKERVEVAGA